MAQKHTLDHNHLLPGEGKSTPSSPLSPGDFCQNEVRAHAAQFQRHPMLQFRRLPTETQREVWTVPSIGYSAECDHYGDFQAWVVSKTT